MQPRSFSLLSASKVLAAVRRGLLWVFLPLAALLALPSLLAALLLWWRAGKTWDAQERWSGIRLLAVVCGGVYAGMLWFSHPLPSLLQALAFGLSHHALAESVVSLERLWELHLLLTPTYALILEGLRPLSRRVRLNPRPVLPRQTLPGEGETSVITAPTPATRASLAQTSTQGPLREPLGECLGGDLYGWIYGNELCIPPEEFARHMVVLGEPGYGKTITLLRLASMALRYGMQVVYIDLKGSTKTAAQFVAVTHLLGVRRIKVYPREPYDGWRGDPKTLYNRLMQMVDAATHPFYRKLTSSLVSLAVNAPGGPPKSSKEFLRRLDTDWLYRAYAGKAFENAHARRKVAKLVPHIDDLSLTFDGFFDGIAGALDGRWAFEDGDAIYIGLDGDAHKEQAALMGRYLLEDCAHYARYRKGPRHALLVLDEFGVLESPNATDLYERVREPGMSVCASAQSYEGLGPERKKVVAASSIKILHRCGDPEELVKYAGEREVPAFSHILAEDEEDVFPPIGGEYDPKRRTTVRMERQYAMPVEAVQQLGVGRVGLITGGLGAWCQVYPLAIPDDLLRSSLAHVAKPQVVSPPPSAPAPPKKTSRQTTSPSGPSAQRQGGDKGRGKQESQVPRSSRVPPSPPPAAPVRSVSTDTVSGNNRMEAPNSVVGRGDDDSPVDF